MNIKSGFFDTNNTASCENFDINQGIFIYLLDMFIYLSLLIVIMSWQCILETYLGDLNTLILTAHIPDACPDSYVFYWFEHVHLLCKARRNNNGPPVFRGGQESNLECLSFAGPLGPNTRKWDWLQWFIFKRDQFEKFNV